MVKIRISWERLMILPSLRTLRAMYLHDAPWDEEKFLRRILRVDDFAVVVFDEPVQHVQMGSAEDEQAR
jgi:hypothetical protein